MGGIDIVFLQVKAMCASIYMGYRRMYDSVSNSNMLES